MLFDKKRKGQAGLTLFLSVIASLFILGIIVMAFSLIGASIRDNDIMYSEDAGYAAVSNETLTSVISGTPEALAAYDIRGVACTFGLVYNGTGGILINSANYTESSECYLNYTQTVAGLNNTNWLINYNYTYDLARDEAEGVINDTIDGMTESTSFFSIIIIIASVVVLILLIVVIINSLRKSGLMGSGGA